MPVGNGDCIAICGHICQLLFGRSLFYISLCSNFLGEAYLLELVVPRPFVLVGLEIKTSYPLKDLVLFYNPNCTEI